MPNHKTNNINHTYISEFPIKAEQLLLNFPEDNNVNSRPKKISLKALESDHMQMLEGNRNLEEVTALDLHYKKYELKFSS